MKIYKDLNDLTLKNTAIAIGKFDGFHEGHRYLISNLIEKKNQGLTTVIFTFTGNPIYYIEGKKQELIMTESEKYYLYEKEGIDVLIEYSLNRENLDKTPEEFIKEILIDKLDMKFFISGDDFRFGKNRKGDVSLLKKFGKIFNYETSVLEKKNFKDRPISSTFIKEELKKGNIVLVNELLGYKYTVIGEIVTGRQIGRQLGVPTINIIPGEDKFIPHLGVYETEVTIDNKEYIGLTNIGYRPTFKENSTVLTVETTLLDTDEDLYGKIAEVRFTRFIRGEKKFNSVEELKNQIQIDLKTIKKK